MEKSIVFFIQVNFFSLKFQLNRFINKETSTFSLGFEPMILRLSNRGDVRLTF